MSIVGNRKQASRLLPIITTVGEALSLSDEPLQIADLALDKLLEVLAIDCCWVQLIDDKTGELTLVTHRGFTPKMVDEITSIKSGQSLTGQVVVTGQPIMIPDLLADARYSLVSPGKAGLHSLAAVPLRSKGRILGVLGIASRRGAQSSVEGVELLTAIASQIGIALDKANLYQQALELIQENKEKERLEFARAIGHELKTPLTSIIAAAELLDEEIQGGVPKTQQRLVQNITHSARSLETNLNELLEATKIEAALSLQILPLNIKGLLERVTEELSPVAKRKKQSLMADLPDSLPVINADAQRLEQALRNLLMNAVKFTPTGGSITLRANKQDSNLVIEVQDSGIGIPKEEQDKLFEPYYRAEADRRHFPGLGLGLFLSKQIVELHGGRIWVTSEPGKGSTFAFSLPLQSK